MAVYWSGNDELVITGPLATTNSTFSFVLLTRVRLEVDLTVRLLQTGQVNRLQRSRRLVDPSRLTKVIWVPSEVLHPGTVPPFRLMAGKVIRKTEGGVIYVDEEYGHMTLSRAAVSAY